MYREFSVFLKNNMEELNKLKKEFNEFGIFYKLPKKTLLDTHLVLDEILSNIINYGYTDDKEHLIEVKFWLFKNVLKLEIIDDSQPFNILKKKDPDIDLPLEKKPIGGLGIYLVKKLMNKMKYLHFEGKNHLFMEKQIIYE